MKRGFTLVELIVVIAMIAILMGAMTSAVTSANRRSRLARAETEAQELTKAILAYANYADDGSLSEFGDLDGADANESNLKYVLGKVNKNGAPVPVLYNASVSQGGVLLDPWGHPYKITVKKGTPVSPASVPTMKVGLFYPNWHRLSEGERQ